MTAAPVGLRAHDRGQPLAREALQALDAGGELLGRHVIGVGAKRAVAPAGVAAIARFAGSAPAAELLAEGDHGDPRLGQRHLQRRRPELGVAPRSRIAAHVRDRLDARPAQELGEEVDRVVGVADGEHLARVAHAAIVAPAPPTAPGSPSLESIGFPDDRPAHKRRRHRRGGPAGPAAGAARARRRRRARDRPAHEPQRHRAEHHDPVADLGRGDRVRRRQHRLRDRGHPGRLRALRRSRPAGRSPGPDRLRRQPRLEPRRRHHLLGHRRGGVRGHRPRTAGDRGVAAGRRRRHGLRGARVRLHGLGEHRPRGRPQADRRSAADRHAAEHQLPGRGAARDRGRPARQAPLRRRAAAGRTRRGRPAALQDLRLRALLRGRAGHRPRRGRAREGGDHADPLRPHRSRGPGAARALGPDRARERPRRHRAAG